MSASKLVAFILAAGRGERMRPLSDERSKPLVPTLNAPHLYWNIRRFADAGFAKCWVNAHYRADEVEKAAHAAGRDLGIETAVSREEPEPLGTAGALKQVADLGGSTFVAFNSDVACDVSMSDLVQAHRSSGAAATLAVVHDTDSSDLVVDSGRVVQFVDRRERGRAGWTYSGIGVFEPEVLEHIPAGVQGLYETVLLGMIEARQPIAAFVHAGYWRDVGTPHDHLSVNLDALSGKVSFAEPAPRLIADDATVGEAELDQVVIGARAQIEDGASLTRCVVWDGALVKRGTYVDCVITPSRVLALGSKERGDTSQATE